MGKRERRQQGREQERKEEESNCQFHECNQFSSIRFSSVQTNTKRKCSERGDQFQSGFGEISTAIIILVPAFFFLTRSLFAFFSLRLFLYQPQLGRDLSLSLEILNQRLRTIRILRRQVGYRFMGERDGVTKHLLERWSETEPKNRTDRGCTVSSYYYSSSISSSII